MNYEHYIAGTQENNIIKHGDNHKTFALVNKYCKNAEQSAKGIWLYLIQQYKNDRRDETYYICKPIRCLAPEKTYVSEDMRHVLDLMTDDYGRDTDYTAARSHLIAERLEKNSGHSIREIRRDFLNGKVTYEQLEKWASTAYMVDPAKAFIRPVKPKANGSGWTIEPIVCGEYDEYYLVCKDEHGEENLWRITAENFANVSHLLPKEYVMRVQENGKLYVSVKANAIICFAGEDQFEELSYTEKDLRVDPFKRNIICMAQENAIKLSVYTRGNIVSTIVSREGDPELFQKALDVCEVRVLNGCYVPKQRTPYTIFNQYSYFFYRPLSPDTMVEVRFDNNMYGNYTLKMLSTDALGKCHNARFVPAEHGTIKMCPVA